MKSVTDYPEKCQRSIQTIIDKTGVDAQTAYAMVLMTAALMDLHPGDENIVAMILQDCGVPA